MFSLQACTRWVAQKATDCVGAVQNCVQASLKVWDKTCTVVETALQRITPVTKPLAELGLEAIILLNAMLLTSSQPTGQNIINIGIDITGTTTILYVLGRRGHHDLAFKLLKIGAIGVISGYAVQSFYMMLGLPVDTYNTGWTIAAASPPLLAIAFNQLRKSNCQVGRQVAPTLPSDREKRVRIDKVRELLQQRREKITAGEPTQDGFTVAAIASAMQVTPELELTLDPEEDDVPDYVCVANTVSDLLLMTSNIFFNLEPSARNHALMSTTLLLKLLRNVTTMHEGLELRSAEDIEREPRLGAHRMYFMGSLAMVAWQYAAAGQFTEDEKPVPTAQAMAVSIIAPAVVVLAAWPILNECRQPMRGSCLLPTHSATREAYRREHMDTSETFERAERLARGLLADADLTTALDNMEQTMGRVAPPN